MPRILISPADDQGCGHYRLIWPARAAIAQGADVVLAEPNSTPFTATFRDDIDGPRLVSVAKPDADVVVIQRPLHRNAAALVPALQAHGVKVIVEIDDDFENISPRNISWRAVQPARSPVRNSANLRHACELADLVTVSTPALAAVYGRHGRVRILPNYVPERYFTITREPHEVVFVGWSGDVQTHPDDLQVTRRGVARALESTGAQFAVVGPGLGVAERLGLNSVPLVTGWQSLHAYPVAVSQFDVGIVPLELSAFNQAKSWLKGVEMASLGVPFVASPTEQYNALAAAGIGALASNARQWHAQLSTLISAPNRDDLAATWRDRARSFTIERHVGAWVEAWSSVVNTAAAS